VAKPELGAKLSSVSNIEAPNKWCRAIREPCNVRFITAFESFRLHDIEDAYVLYSLDSRYSTQYRQQPSCGMACYKRE
jgi:hypothetical protein